MSEFEYITVLLSIILGLAVTQLLAGFARLLRDGRALAPAWWIIVIIAALLLSDFQIWWISFVWQDVVRHWMFYDYLAFMVLPMLMYLLAYLVLPNDLRLDGHELAREFIDRRKPFYICLALVPLASFGQQWLLSGHPPSMDLDTAFRLVLLALSIPGFLSRQSGVQATLAVVALLNVIGYVSLTFTRL